MLMTFWNSLHLGVLAKPVRLSQVIKYVVATIILAFCVVNVYRGVTVESFSSSHDYLRQGDSVQSRARFRSLFNFSNWAQLPTQNPVEDYAERLRKIRILREEDYPEYNVTVDGVTRPVPLWQRKLQVDRARRRKLTENGTNSEDLVEDEDVYFFLVEVLQVRIYSADKARWSVKELKQWLHYMFLAGVEHVYLCDHFMFDHERLEKSLLKYIDLRLLTYLPRGSVRDPMTAQIQCYQHIINRFKRQHVWQMAIDIDEYPFSPNETRENFLVHYLRNISAHVSEISMPNYLMLGRGDRGGQTVIDRINRMTPRASNDLVKPIYRPQNVRASVHHNHILSGSRVDADPDQLRMLHYWGGRGQQWATKDSRKTLAITNIMNDMRNVWAERLTNSLIVFGDDDALGNSTGL